MACLTMYSPERHRMGTWHVRRHALAAGLLVCALAACQGAISELDPPPAPPGDGTKPPTTVQRASITVNVSIDPGDADIASRAQLSLAGATVRVVRVGSGEPERAGTLDPTGTVRLDSLLEGRYAISVDRVLSNTELARLEPSQRDAAVFAGGAQVNLAPPSPQTVSLSLVASRRGSLIISELFAYRPDGPNFYSFGNYLEVYNNADTTVYLDGVLLFRTTSMLHSASPMTCARSQAFRTDRNVLWSRLVWAFPGSGRDFPLPPGTAKVVAMDAIDHRTASPLTQQVDLSRADFEEIGNEADTDNPFAANLVRVQASPGALGRGYPLETRRSFGLARPSARNRLQPDVIEWSERGQDYKVELYGIPQDDVLDVVSTTYTPQERAALEAVVGPVIDCDPWLADTFERAVAQIPMGNRPEAVARKSLGRTSAGVEILQRTRTSARDFEYVTPLRRSLNR